MEIHFNSGDPETGRAPIKSLHPDWSALTLVASNLLTIAIAVYQKWNPGTVMWIYWGQSIIIGAFNVVRMWTLQNFTTDGLKMNDQPVAPTTANKRFVAIFFMAHYGFFHLVYAIFLVTMSKLSMNDIMPILICVAGFLVNHWFSYCYNKDNDSARKVNLGTLMFFPYARIIPLHITIITGLMLSKTMWALVLFLSLKTVADLIMHAVEHRAFGKTGE
jgi:hypothetical protein